MLSSPRTPTSEIRKKLNPADWEKRMEDARQREAVISQVEAARAAGETSISARARIAPDVGRSTYQAWRRRYETMGLEGLIDHHCVQEPTKVTPVIRAAILAMREADPDIDVERIVEVVARRHGVTISDSWVRKLLAQAGLNRPHGGKRRQTVARELHFAGGIFPLLADMRLGLSERLTDRIIALRKTLPDPAEERPVDRGGRDQAGRFAADWSERLRKEEGHLGPAFRSVEETREEQDLARRRLASEQRPTIARKMRAMLFLPALTENGRTIELRDYRGGYGVAEFAGTLLRGETLDRFARDCKYLGVAESMMECQAGTWLDWERQAFGDAVDSPAAAMIFVDGVSKGHWTQYYSKCGKVSNTGRVMPCLDMVMVHTGMGTPIYWQTFGGHASLVTQTLPLLGRLEQVVGEGWFADKLVVIDREGDSVGLFKQFDAPEPGKRLFLTRLDDDRVRSLDDVEELGPWEVWRGNEEAASGWAWLNDSKAPTEPYRVRVVVLRKPGREGFRCLGTNAPPERFGAGFLAKAYFSRWPKQEGVFRELNQSVRFKRIHGYGRRLVQNVVVLGDLDDRQATLEKMRERLERKKQEAAKLRQQLIKAKRTRNAAIARQSRQEDFLAEEMESPYLDRGALQHHFDKSLEAREQQGEAIEKIAKVEQKHRLAAAAVAKIEDRIPGLEAEIEKLQGRKEIYQPDVELDTFFAGCKLGFVLLIQAALSMFFPGLKISLHGFIRYIFSLPGTSTVEGKVEHIRIRASIDRDVMRVVEAACERANELGLTRNGRKIKLSVDWGPVATVRGAKGHP